VFNLPHGQLVSGYARTGDLHPDQQLFGTAAGIRQIAVDEE
jgi:hypothetical protein